MFTLAILNRPDDVALVLSHAVGNTADAQEQLGVTRRIREALIKSGSIGGFPKASNFVRSGAASNLSVRSMANANANHSGQTIRALLALK